MKAFARFAYEFFVGDDWTIAAAVVIALVITAASVSAGLNMWWLLPVVVLSALAVSVWRAR